MIPIIIIPDDKKEVTLQTDNLKKYIMDAYYSGYNDGYINGKNENEYDKYKSSEKIEKFLNINSHSQCE